MTARIMRAFILLAFAALAVAKRSFEGDQVLTFTPTTGKQLEIIQWFGGAITEVVDFWKPESADQVNLGTKVDLLVNSAYLQTVKEELEQSLKSSTSGNQNLLIKSTL